LTGADHLEHIDSESLHINRHGTPDDVNGTKLKFYKGDIIFGRRRAYQRKAGIANWDGFCSAHALVLRANPDVIDPELFPFFLHSDLFMNRAIDISVGSLSPTINWGTLKHQEFSIPPIESQVELSKLLWSLDYSVQTVFAHRETLKRSYKTLLNQLMIHGPYSSDGEVKKTKSGLLDERLNVIQLKDCLLEKPSYGANASSKSYEKGLPRCIRITDIDDDGKLIDDELVTIDAENYDDYVLEDNDFLFARTGNTVGKTHLYRSTYGSAVYAGYLIRFRLNQQLLRPKFLFYFTKSLKFESFKRKMVKVGAQPNINSEEYQSMYLPELHVTIQDDLIEKLDSYCEIIDLAENKLTDSKILQTRLINKVF
ncbi:restriction endonuclease subunit S, partial [Vibrio kanaloae]|uniref:restriction endonuclease subunit S n=1 Tax=Vibrio kanaloae TaxID=170673 RepID=UPI003553F296